MKYVGPTFCNLNINDIKDRLTINIVVDWQPVACSKRIIKFEVIERDFSTAKKCENRPSSHHRFSKDALHF